MAARAKTVLTETNASIRAAVAAGRLNATLSAGPIAAIRKLAEQIDRPGFPYIGEKFDNVSLPTYLKYAEQLGLTPGSKAEATRKGGGSAKSSNLSRLKQQQGKRSA